MNKLLLSGLAAFGLLSNYGLCGDSAWCDEYLECADETLDYENIYCVGFESCEGATMISEENVIVYGSFGAIDSTIMSGYNGYCYGPLACYGAEVNITNDFYNYGLASTYDTEVRVGDDYFGHGAYCGYGATIRGSNEDGDYSYVYGFLGGAFSTHKGFYRLYAYGYLAMYYADITSKGDGEETNYLVAYGYYATYGAEYTCQSEDTCYIYCDGVGCDGMDVYIEDGASYYTNCNDGCNICPNITQLDSTMDEYKNTKEYQSKQKIKMQHKEWLTKLLGFDNVINDKKDERRLLLEEKKEESKTNKHSKNEKREASKDFKRKESKHDRVSTGKINRKSASMEILKRHKLHPKFEQDGHKKDEAHLAVFNDMEIGNNHKSSFNKKLMSDIVSYGVGIVSVFVVALSANKLQSYPQKN